MVSKAVCVSLLILAIASPVAYGILLCQNGGTYDRVLNECVCTAHFHGHLCEHSFSTSNPCSWSNVTALLDRFAVHRLGNHQVCSSSPDQQCIDFSVVRSGWYRVQSPAGNYLVSECPKMTADCGSRTPYYLNNEVPEDNLNIRLSKARAYRYRSGLTSGCSISSDASYPVRILRCSPYHTLFYLSPLPRGTHYCIGDKKRCPPGTSSIDGSGFEPCTQHCSPQLVNNPVAPKLRLEYEIPRNSKTLYSATFYCDVFSIFKPNWTDIARVRYKVDFLLALRNGSTLPISDCNKDEVIIDHGKNRTFHCESEKILTERVNVYGGSLVCRVQARCDGSGNDYNSAIIPSNSHGFHFTHWFQNQTDVITPNRSVTLCVSSKNIPVNDYVTFFVSVGRRQIILNDKINVSVLRRDSNETCGFKMLNHRLENKKICIDLTLINYDSDSRIPVELAKADQLSVIKVNIYFESRADGLSTVPADMPLLRYKIHDIELKVDLTRLQKEVTDYLHVFFDPYIKPADKSHSQTCHVSTPSAQHFMLLKHKLLPYEIQGTIIRDATIDVTLRYVYDVIHITGSSVTKRLSYQIVHKDLPPGVKDPLRKKPDGLPMGVTLTVTPQVIKVRFDLYGTVLYVWGFRTNPNLNSCPNRFVMSNAIMNQQPCTGQSLIPKQAPHKLQLDLMLIPGFYDTKALTEGMMYAVSCPPRPITNLREVLLDERYQMKPIQAIDSQIQPTEVLNICGCGEDSSGRLTSTCHVSIDNITPSKEQLHGSKQQHQPPQLPPRRSAESRNLKKVIHADEAEVMCNKFVQIQLSKSLSTQICSQTTGPIGEENYISRFISLCVSFATTLGNYEFSQSVFNSVLDMCYTDMTYNASVVLRNLTQIEMLLENICPANCSNRGVCISGACSCDGGFYGASCEHEISKIHEITPKISLLQKDLFCPSDNCSAVFLMVNPILQSEECECHLLLDSSHKTTIPATFISGDIVMCDLTSQHKWIHDSFKIYAPLQVRLTAATWNATNNVDVLLHLTSCGNQPVVCDAITMTCRVGGSAAVADAQALDPSVEINICLFSAQGRMESTSATAPLFGSKVTVAINWLISVCLLRWQMW